MNFLIASLCDAVYCLVAEPCYYAPTLVTSTVKLPSVYYAIKSKSASSDLLVCYVNECGCIELDT